MLLRKVGPIYVFDCTYNERHVPSGAKFYWHGKMGSCQRERAFCIACQLDVYSKWWTFEDEKAELLREYAAPKAKAALDACKRLAENARIAEEFLMLDPPEGTK